MEYGNQNILITFQKYIGDPYQPGIYGSFIHYAYDLAQTINNTVNRIQTAKSDQLLIVIFEESLVYLKLLFYVILMFSAALWIGFILGMGLGYALAKSE